jgi:predicted metal-dependent phosphoesterase TrpH
MRLDLHMHTTASDGSWSPEAVVRGAAAGGLDVISITDHDTAAGFEVAKAVGEELNVQVIPGIEVSSTFEGRDIHVLGYFFDVGSPPLIKHAARAKRRREDRMREMIERLGEQGVHVTFQQVEAAAGPDRVVIGRPHLAKALVGAGYAASVPETFNHLIGDDSPAFVPTHLLDPVGAIELILSANGIPVWAHPPGDMVDQLVPIMRRAGLKGLEAYRPRHRRAQVLRFESICRTTGLLARGGSDWHSPDYGAALGDFHVAADEIEGLLEAGGL